MWQWILENKDMLLIISIPFTSGFIGWFTNMIALKMTFYPIKFWGIPPFLGWQGIIPRKSYKMAGKAVDMLTSKLVKVEEIFDRVEPKQMASEMSPPVRELTTDIVNEVGESSNPQMWQMVPAAVRDGIYSRVNSEVEPLIETVVKDSKDNIMEIFDLKQLVIKNLTGDNVRVLNEMFQRCGEKEFKFIEISGFYFGFLFGIVQAAIWYFYAQAWTLPLVGVLVGYYTNWLALKMIFRPLYEKKYLGFIKYQGLFLKRQKEVSKEYAALVAGKILTAKNILEAILYGKTADSIFTMIQKNIYGALDRIEGFARPVVSLIVGTNEYDAIRNYIVSKLTAVVPATVMKVENYMDQAMDLENTIYSRMSVLPPEDFENLLRTAFQEDEWILISVGAVLGFLVGLTQALLF